MPDRSTASPVGPAPSIRRIVGEASEPGDIALGPDHPTLDGLPRIAVAMQDRVVHSAEWIPGGVHRGAEKLMESRDVRQAIMLADRHDWLSAFCSEVGLAVAAERALGMTPPPRAQLLRILLCELTRIAHHLAFLAPLPMPLPPAWRGNAWAWREEILDLIEQASGQRIHPMLNQVGGLRAAPPAGWVARVAKAARDSWPQRVLTLAAEPIRAAVAHHGTGVAVLSRPTALGTGASGPVTRASGVDLDLRRDDPCLPYPSFTVPVDTAGDAAARVSMLMAELTPSVGLVQWSCAQAEALEGAPVSVRQPRVVRIPESATYTWTENPSGINGYLLVSANGPTPVRVKIRSAGFGNACALGLALAGTRDADLPMAIASFGLVCGDVDR